jgi:hypothetical protein
MIQGIDKHSHINVTWLSNMEKKFFIHRGNYAIDEMYKKLKYYNQLCEYDRNFDGQDDEPEDEVLLLK